jgi:hypothetical protein
MLEISPSKVALVITKAREFDARVEPWDEASSASDTALSADDILESRTSDAVGSELAEFIARLSEYEQANLVALAWVGRGLFTAEEFDEAVATAKAERSIPTEDYLLGIPVLAEYLEGGLEKLGYSVEAIEKDVL